MNPRAIAVTLGCVLSFGASLSGQPRRIGPARVRPATAAAGPARAAPPGGGAQGAPVGMPGAARCMREHASDDRQAHQCVIRALTSVAAGEPELGLLAHVYRSEGRDDDAARTMRIYLERFPHGARRQLFQRWLAAH